jgi:hypothetical protein
MQAMVLMSVSCLALEVGGKTKERPLHQPDMGEIGRDLLVAAALAGR